MENILSAEGRISKEPVVKSMGDGQMQSHACNSRYSGD